MVQLFGVTLFVIPLKNSIAIDGDIVFAQDAQGFLYAIDTETGKLCWEKQLPVNGLPASSTDWWPMKEWFMQEQERDFVL